MNAQEKRIAKAIRGSIRRTSRAGRPPQVVAVHLNPDGSYGYVSGPEIHTVRLGGGPRQRRRVWAIRYGCDPRESAPGIARGGFSWALSRTEAVAKLHEHSARMHGSRTRSR